MENGMLPEVQLYAVGPAEAERVAPLLTAEAVMLIKAGEAAGMALAEEGEVRAAACARLAPEDEETLELISLYTAPAFRRRGLGGTLLMELLEGFMAALDGSLRRVTAAFTRENQGVESLLARAGFQIEPDEQAVSRRLPAAALADSILLTRRAALPEGCTLHTLGQLPDHALRALEQELRKNGIDDLTAAEMRQAMQDASTVLLDREGCPCACAIMTGQDGGAYLSQFYTAGGSAGYAMAVLQAAARQLLAQLPSDAVLEIPVLTASSARLVQRLLPESAAEPLLRGVLRLDQ